MQKLLLLFTIALIVRSEPCQIDSGSVVYDCKDLTTGACSGSIGGRTCTVIDNACSYKKCSSLSSANCKTILLDGEQCFNKANGSCAGATQCSNFDNKDACKTFQGISCVWNDDQGRCDNSSCKDITVSDSCMQTSINGQPCQWYGNISGEPQCQVAQCSFRTPEQCNGKKEGGYNCIKDNQGCRQQTCADLSVGALPDPEKTAMLTDPANSELKSEKMCKVSAQQLSISATTFCYNQQSADGSSACSAVQDCKDNKSKDACTNITISNVTCVWSGSEAAGACKRQTCGDFNKDSCPSSANGVTCTKFGETCTSCGQISEPCECLANSACIYTYIAATKIIGCTDRVCSVFANPDECKSPCYWQPTNLKCSNTPEGGQPVLSGSSVDDSQSDFATLSQIVIASLGLTLLF